MGFGEIIYIKIPKLISGLRLLRSQNSVYSRGLKFKLVTNNWITKYRARTFNDKEPETLDWLDQNLRDGDIFFDVGANIGIYSIYAALRSPKTTVYAFEAEYSNLHELKQNILLNSLAKRIYPYSMALYDNTGISQLHIQDTTPGAALHSVLTQDCEKTQMGHAVVWKEGVATITIDDFYKISGIIPNILKIDVDGNELKILNGARKIFMKKNFRSIIIEMIDSLPDYQGINNFLLGHGFKLEKKFKENQIWSR